MDTSPKNDIKSRMIAPILVVVSLALISHIVVKYIKASKALPRIVVKAPSASKQDPKSSSHNAKRAAMVTQLKKNSRFTPPKPPKAHAKKAPQPVPPKNVQGILGKEALIDGKWCKVGDLAASGAKVLATDANSVTFLWQNEHLVLTPLGAKFESGSVAAKMASASKSEKRAKSSRVSRRSSMPPDMDGGGMVHMESEGDGKFGDMGMVMPMGGMSMSPEELKEMEQWWKKNGGVMMDAESLDDLPDDIRKEVEEAMEKCGISKEEFNISLGR